MAVIPFYTQVILWMLQKFILCHKIVLSFKKFRCPHPKSNLLENCNKVRAADVFVDSVFIIVVMGCRDKVIRHHIIVVKW